MLAYAAGRQLLPNPSRTRKCDLQKKRRMVLPPVAVAAPHGSMDLPAREAPIIWRHRQHQHERQLGLQLTTEQREALWQLVRGWNIAPSILLTLVGAWLGEASSPATTLTQPTT